MIGYQTAFCHTTLEEIAFAITGLGPTGCKPFAGILVVCRHIVEQKVACFQLTIRVVIERTEGRPESETEKTYYFEKHFGAGRYGQWWYVSVMWTLTYFSSTDGGGPVCCAFTLDQVTPCSYARPRLVW